jgi:hypothetical protein
VPDPTPDRQHTAEEVDRALDALTEPDRLRHAQEVITHAAPALQQILDEALREGGYLEAAGGAIKSAVGTPDPDERLALVRTLMAEETRLGMLIGASVGFELARELARQDDTTQGN